MNNESLKIGFLCGFLIGLSILCFIINSGWIRVLAGILFAILVYLICRIMMYFNLYTNIQKDLYVSKQDYVHLEDKVAEFDVQKTEFISIASHQLRTPLSITRGYLELIQDGAYGEVPVELVSPITDVREANEQLIHLVESLLQVSQIEQGQLHVSLEKVDLIAICKSVYEELDQVSRKKGIEMQWDLPSSLYMKLDAEKIRIVIFNLIENAIKYTDEGSIHISLEVQNEYVIFRVKDMGRGFNLEEGQYIFQKFYRAHNATQEPTQGSGLGLYISRQIVEAHGGSLEAYSDGPGMGSTFTCFLKKEILSNAVYHIYSEEA